MQRSGFALTAAVAAVAMVVGTIGCEVREEPRPRRHVVVYEPPPPPPPGPVVVYEPAPAPPVEVIPVAPGPDYVWVGGGYYRDHGRWVWRRGYYDHRYHR